MPIWLPFFPLPSIVHFLKQKLGAVEESVVYLQCLKFGQLVFITYIFYLFITLSLLFYIMLL